MKTKTNSQKGQVILEAVLLAIIFVGVWLTITKHIKESAWMKTLVETGPWPKLNGMIESGVWDTASKARVKHPNNSGRGVSKKEIP